LKCFLTRVKNVHFLAVLDIHRIFDLRPNIILNAYHKPLLDLLGEKYDTVLDHLCFILTKNDCKDGIPGEMSYTAEQLQRKIQQIGFDLTLGSSAQSSVKLIYRVLQRHTFVNLSMESRDKVLENIQNMIDLDSRQRQSVGRVEDLNIDYLDAQENKLNRLCQFYAEQQVKKVAKISSKLPLLRNEMENKKLELRGDANNLRDYKQIAFDHAVEFDKEFSKVRLVRIKCCIWPK